MTMNHKPALRKSDVRMPDTVYIVIDRWQLSLDTADRAEADNIWGGTPAIVFSSFDFEEARQEWWRLLGPHTQGNQERRRYALVEVAADAS